MKIGRLGVWAFVDALSATEVAGFARNVEDWGYSALWTGEALGRDVLINSSWLLANTTKLIVASGIANIYSRDPMAMAAARAQLNEQSGGRFMLGLGVSHAQIVDAMRGHSYERPVKTMREYLEKMARAHYSSVMPDAVQPTMIAALGPKMLELSRDLADGSHPYNITVDQTASSRQILGHGKLLCVEQKLLLETDAARARAIARATLKPYLGLPNYVNSWRRAGFGDSDFSPDLSDRLIDALVAWGDEKALIARIRAHWEAGADHVCIQALYADADRSVTSGPNTELLAQLAPLAQEMNLKT